MKTLDDPRPRGGGPVDGVVVRLSDGGWWTLPLRDTSLNDPEYDALLAAVFEAEDRAEGLRAELALTIFLLTRSYDLSADRLNALLSFEPDRSALPDLQKAVHGLVVESMSRSRAAAVRAGDARSARAPGAAFKGPRLVRAHPAGSSRF